MNQAMAPAMSASRHGSTDGGARPNIGATMPMNTITSHNPAPSSPSSAALDSVMLWATVMLDSG